MKVSDLAEAVVAWLDYQRLCGRESLLSEASLTFPVGEYLGSVSKRALVAEQHYPDSMQPKAQGRRKSADYCLIREGGKRLWTDVVEAKWVNGRRDISQEVFDDLLRLECVRQGMKAQFSRYLLVAGPIDRIKDHLLEKRAGNPKALVFDGVISAEPDTALVVPVALADERRLPYWKKAAKAAKQNGLPLNLNTRLNADRTSASFRCLIWRVTSVQRRATRSLTELNP